MKQNYILIAILLVLIIGLAIIGNPNINYQPKTVWEHYCKYTLRTHPKMATQEQLEYFIDCWAESDEYQYLYDYYAEKYPEYNSQPNN